MCPKLYYNCVVSAYGTLYIVQLQHGVHAAAHAQARIHLFFLVLQAFLRGQSGAVSAYELSQLSDISGSMTQEAILLEREVTNYWLAHFFQAEKTKTKDRSWEALLLMWLRTVSQYEAVI